MNCKKTQIVDSEIEALFKQSVRQHQLGNADAAEQGYRRVLDSRPEHIGAMHMLAALAIERNDLAAAETGLRRAFALKASWALGYDLAYVLDVSGRADEAETYYRKSIEMNPGALDALYNLGTLLKNQYRLAEAVSVYSQALAVDPRHAPTHNNLGLILSVLGRPAEAEAHYRTALVSRPEHPQTLNNLGMALFEQHKLSGAREVFEHVVELDASHAHAAGKVYHIGQQLCAWNGQSENENHVRATVARKGQPPVSPFDMLASDFDALTFKEIARLHVEEVEAGNLKADEYVGHTHRYGHARVRVGYLSADITHHPVTLLIAGVLERHDRTAFDVRVYSYGPDRGDMVRERIRNAVETFQDVSGESDAEIAERIAADEIDILVDLTGYTQHGRPGITARRPAPVQVNWLGYPGSLGHERMADYLIGDPVLTPLEHAAHYSETLAQMPYCYQPTDRDQAIGPTPSRAELGLPESGVVFCSFNQGYKLNAEMFDVWCRLLREVPGSVLWLLGNSAEAIANLRREAEARGVTAERLVFADKVSLDAHLGRLAQADLALDTYPYGSGATGSNTLWAGVPMVTRLGETYVSRMAASQLHAIGLPELVTESAEAYFELAKTLALDTERRLALRERLKRNRLTQPLFDTARYTRDLERLYRQMLAQERAPIVLEDSDERAEQPFITKPPHPAVDTATAARIYAEAVAAHRQGRLDVAEAGYRRAAELSPGHADSVHMLGVLHGQLGRHELAEANFRAALAVGERELYWRNYAKFLVERGRLDEAEAAYKNGLKCEPGNARCLQGLAQLAAMRGQRGAAPAPAMKQVDPATESAEAHEVRGIALHRQGDLAGAERAFRQALAIDPGLGRAWYNLGCILYAIGRLDEAEASLLKAVQLSPKMSHAYNNLGMVQFEKGQNRQAESSLKEATRLDPNNWNAWSSLGALLTAEGRFTEAIDVMRRALELGPRQAFNLSTLLHATSQVYLWREQEAWRVSLVELLARNSGAVHSIFPLLALPGIDAAMQRRIAEDSVRSRLGDLLETPPLVSVATRYSHDRPRIGYLSGDVFHHPVTLLVTGVLARHQRTEFDVRVYSYGMVREGAIHEQARVRMALAAEQFIDLQGWSDSEIAERIAADQVDILIDLTGYTLNGRAGITARRPAPVQVNWLGYPGSLGHERMADYLIGDPVLTPLEHAAHYSETLAQMPYCYQPTDRDQAIGPTPSRAELGLPESGVVFCSFNQGYKLNAEMFDVWCRLLREVPGSVLWLLGNSAEAIANLRREAEARGVAAERLVFADKVSLDAHLGRLAQADLALDTYPYGSGATGSNTLWAGVPMVTRLGETYVSRMAASQLHAIGLPELVTESAEAYFELAKTLALDTERRLALRERLKRNRLTQPLFDTARYTRDLERLYRQMLAPERVGSRQPIFPSPPVESMSGTPENPQAGTS